MGSSLAEATGPRYTAQEIFRRSEINQQSAQVAAGQGVGPWSAANYRNGSDVESDRVATVNGFIEAFANPGAIDRSDGSLLAAGPGYSGGFGKNDWQTGRPSLMSQEELRRQEILYRNQTEPSSTTDSAAYPGQGLRLPAGYAVGAFSPTNSAFSTSAFGSAMNWLADARASDQAFYSERINGAESGVAASLYTMGRAFNGAAYDLGQGAATLYGLATDGDLRSKLFNGIGSTVGSFLDNPLGSFKRGGYAISNYLGNTSIGQIGEDALRFGAGTLAGAGVGRLSGAAGSLAMDTAGSGLRYAINALPEASFNRFMQASNALDKALYQLNPANYQWSGMAPGTLGAIPTPTGLKLSGIVEVRVPIWATAAQKADYALYTRVANEALEAGYLSPVGRVATSKTGLRIEADRAIAAERAQSIQQGRPYQGVVGHGPDTTWTGKPEAFRWLDQDFRVNSSLGGQSGRYPLGFKPTDFVLKGSK